LQLQPIIHWPPEMLAGALLVLYLLIATLFEKCQLKAG
jgi:hypothetical protein